MIRRLAAVALAVLLLLMQGEQAAGLVPCPLHQAAHTSESHAAHDAATTPDHATSCTCVGACQVPAPATIAPSSPSFDAPPPVFTETPVASRSVDPRPSFPHQLPYSTAPPATC